MSLEFRGFSFNPSTGEFHGQTSSDGGPRPPRTKKIRAPKPAWKRLIFSSLITLAVALVYFYFKLPALNMHSADLYVFVILVSVVFCVCELVGMGFHAESLRDYVKGARKKAAVPFYIICACLAIAVVGSVIGWKIFRARDYSELISINEGNFGSEVAEISFSQIPMLDKDSANVLANRKLGELSDLVSQFEVYGDSYQINYKGKPVRVTYLNYGDFFKWWSNMRKGIPAYLIIDMVTQEVSVQRLEKGIRYSPSEYFFRNIARHLRFQYPTKMFSDINFEIDENGQPWWVATVITKKVGLFGGPDVLGAVLVDAVTGESKYYDVADVPSWVDRVYNAELIVDQYDLHGMYQNGFWNSLFSQSGCTETTRGYNYIAQNDDVWLYTGVTSVTGDQGNIGFLLVNQRTKEAKYYSCAGAEEFSAMSSAQGAVQQYSYKATFPLLLNIGGQPTYFVALKDASNLVKMYAMVNVQQYQIVATGTSVPLCAKNYGDLLVSGGILNGDAVSTGGGDYIEMRGRVAEIRTAVIEGNTRYYFRLEGESGERYFWIGAVSDPSVVLIDVGDPVVITYALSDDADLFAAISVKKG